MSATNKEKPLDGLTEKAQAGQKSNQPLTDGNETDEMTLAILNSALQTLIANNRAHLVGRITTKNAGAGTMVLFYGVEPESANKLRLIK